MYSHHECITCAKKKNEITSERKVDQCDTIDGGWGSHDVLDKVTDLFCEYCIVAQSIASHVANKSENNQYGCGTWICF
jgi:hypothetical protein